MNKLKNSKIWNSKWPAVILMLVGVCFMGYGISRGELAVVFVWNVWELDDLTESRKYPCGGCKYPSD